MAKSFSACGFAGLALLALAPRLASAEGAAATTAASETEKLKQAVLDLAVERLQRTEPPPANRNGMLDVYAGPGTSGARLLAASVTIDDRPAFAHGFTASESAALNPGGLYRLAHVELPAGEHRLRARLVLRPVDTPAAADRTTLDVDQAVTLAPAPLSGAVELRPGRDNPLGAWQLQLDSVRRAPFNPGKGWSLRGLLTSALDNQPVKREVTAGEDDDPVLRHVRFLAANAQYLEAAARLEALRLEVTDAALPPAYALKQSRALAQYGLFGRALAIERQAVAAGADPDAAWSVRLDLAEAYLEADRVDAAEAVLGASPGQGKSPNLSRWQDLKSRVLIAQGRLGEAAAVLQGNSSGTDYDSYVRYYNLAMVYVAEGRVDQGLTILDRVGQLRGSSPRLQTLVDRANLALGAWFLHHGQGGTAIPVLGRIGASGPSANRAFLDLGWAWLAPEGVVHQQVEIGDERSVGVPPEAAGQQSREAYDQNVYQRYTVTPFVRVDPGKDGEARLKQALAVWSRAQDRDPDDEAVEETLLAMGYALDQLGAHQEALQYLERSKAAMQRSLRSFDRVLKYVDSSQFGDDMVRDDSPPGQFGRELKHLPPPELASSLYETLAGREFHGLLADDRDLQALSAQLAQWVASPDVFDTAGAAATELRARIVRAQAQDLARMRQKIDHDLEPQIRWRLRLLENTQFELARLYEASL